MAPVKRQGESIKAAGPAAAKALATARSKSGPMSNPVAPPPNTATTVHGQPRSGMKGSPNIDRGAGRFDGPDEGLS